MENVFPLPVEPYAKMHTLFMSSTESAMSLTELNKSVCDEFGPARRAHDVRAESGERQRRRSRDGEYVRGSKSNGARDSHDMSAVEVGSDHEDARGRM